MKIRTNLLFGFIIFLGFYIFTPKHIVWGGSSMQTVPTIGPSPTASTTATITATSAATVSAPTATSVSTPATTQQATVSITLITPLENTLRAGLQPTFAATSTQNQATPVVSSTENNLSPTISSSGATANQPGNEADVPVESQNDDHPESTNLPPQWLFPFLGATILVVIFLIIKRMIEKRKFKNSDK